MAFNVTNAVEVPLSTFGSMVTEMSPSDLPEGVSPDNQDVVYVPGNVQTRGAMSKVFSTPFPGNPTVRYAKSYVMPTGDIKNLYLDSTGALWVEDLTNAPGTYSLLLQTTPGMYARSITAFGREYIAISDGLHGQEVPFQYDGTYIDRVTQDGPGTAPVVQNQALPSVSMATTAPPPTLTVTEIDPANPNGSGYYTAVNIFISGSAAVAQPGMSVTISGNSNSSLNISFPIAYVYSGANSLIICYANLPPGTAVGTGGIATIGSGYTINRQNNIVTCTTTSPSYLQVGYQVQITGMTADNTIGGGINSVVINNEDNPGIATVTTNSAHGLLPENFVTLTGIAGTNVGGTISASSVEGDVLSVTTSTAHRLTPGALITITGNSITAACTTFNVATVSSQYAFQCIIVAADATGSGGTVTINWPIPDTATPNYYQVQSAPTSNTFQVQVSYADGTWSGGTVSFAWDGYFFVTAVQSATQFQYQQYGPDASTMSVGTVTPFGQIAPGAHQMQVLFLTRQGAITEPSPPVKFIANGGQYLHIANIPIGPPNVVARILAFTGAEGDTFFYIPVPAQNNGVVVSTATQINDNTTSASGVDFSDNTLYASVGISVPGNNLASQIVLDSALGFGFFDSRLLAFGMRNRLQNLLNLSFDGGYLPSIPSVPTGWTVVNAGGALATGHFGQGWNITCTAANTHYGGVTQSFYEDAYGVPISTANTPYLLRVWLQPSAAVAGLSFNVRIYSTLTGYQSNVSIDGTQMSVAGSWIELPFANQMPPTIPADMQFSLYAMSSTTVPVTLLVDELSVIYAQTPYLDTEIYGSYVDNPEGFDGVTGKFGASLDTNKLLDFGVLRDQLYLLTQDPGGRIHSVANNGVTEPSGWTVSEIGANCGILSAFSLTKSQADDNSASGGEEWMAWASSSGARMFGGEQPWKISQEIQPDWDSINAVAAKTIWAMNDPVARVIYFGLPTGTNTTPNLIYPMNYRELDTAYEIAKSPPVHTSFSGKLIATDNTRKWTRWNLAMNGCALMYRGVGLLEPVFFSGSPYGNVYSINSNKYTDDDYGQIFSYYTTYFFVNHEMEMALQLGGHLKMVAYFTAYVYGVGVITITPLVNQLANPWALTLSRNMSTTPPNYDMEWGGGNARGQRIAFKFASSPTIGPFGVDNAFTLSKMIVTLRPNARLPVRGAA